MLLLLADCGLFSPHLYLRKAVAAGLLDPWAGPAPLSVESLQRRECPPQWLALHLCPPCC